MLDKVLKGAKTLLTGMGITARAAMTKPVTREYPHVKPEMSEAYRSCIQLVRFPETGSHDCVACMQCVNICPSFCIAIDGEKLEGIKKQRAVRFEVDFALCSLCGLCIDACPTTTLEYSKRFEEAGYSRRWVYDLLVPFRDGEEAFVAAQREREAAAAAAKKAEAAAAAAAKKAAALALAAESPAPAAESPAPAESPTPSKSPEEA